jgi:hypothetical protein
LPSPNMNSFSRQKYWTFTKEYQSHSPNKYFLKS